jgi:hypothetical protein
MKTKNLIIELLIMLCFCCIASAQITFQKTYGGIHDERGESVQQTIDGGYIITGYTTSFGVGLADFYLLKTDSNGIVMWTRTFGGSNLDYGYSVQQTTDEGYIIAGSSNSFGAGNDDVYLIKTDINGVALWTKTIGGADDDYASTIKQTSDGGYIIAGLDSGYINLIKTDVLGNTLWTKNYYGGLGSYSVQQTTNGYCISGGIGDVYLMKTDTIGDVLWTKTFGGTNEDWGYSGQLTTDGGYIISGPTYSFGAGNWHFYFLKTDTNGTLMWTKTFGGPGYDISYSVQQTTDGGYVIAGSTKSFGAGNEDVYLIKTNTNGDTLWTKTFGGVYTDLGYSVMQTKDGGYIITGFTESFGAGGYDIYLIKTDAFGNSGCNQGSTATIVGTPSTQITNPSTIATTVNNIEGTPATLVGSGGTVTTLCTNGTNEIISKNLLTIFPNPTTNNLTIENLQKATIEILNIQGQLIKTIETTEDKTSIDISNLPGGVYIIKLNTAEGSVVRKFIKD